MAENWPEKFSRWARPPSETEESKAERAARMVRDALRAHVGLRDRNFDVIAVGSYRNNTNVRTASDVDLAAVLKSAQWSEFPADRSVTREMVGLIDVDYGLTEFRGDVRRALQNSFGASDISPGKIALSIDGSSARLGADVIPYLLHRRYTGGRGLVSGNWETVDGIETRPEDQPNRRIIQWPEQHYAAGVAKNEATNRRYKRVVRILKCLRDELAEHGSPEIMTTARETRSCFLEHAAFNVPDSQFDQAVGSYYDDVRSVISRLWNAARQPNDAAGFWEVSGMQRLFRNGEPWSPALLERFALGAWQYVGFPK